MAFLLTTDGRKKTANSGELELLEVPFNTIFANPVSNYVLISTPFCFR